MASAEDLEDAFMLLASTVQDLSDQGIPDMFLMGVMFSLAARGAKAVGVSQETASKIVEIAWKYEDPAEAAVEMADLVRGLEDRGPNGSDTEH